VKRFVSLQFLNPRTVGRTPWKGDPLVLIYRKILGRYLSEHVRNVLNVIFNVIGYVLACHITACTGDTSKPLRMQHTPIWKMHEKLFQALYGGTYRSTLNIIFIIVLRR
jgi:hypothetical protein